MVNTPLIPKQKYNKSHKKPITKHINTTLPNPQMVTNNNQKYQQIEINKEKFKNLVTRKYS